MVYIGNWEDNKDFGKKNENSLTRNICKYIR